MADLFSMKSPLIIRLANGETHIMAEYFRHPRGLLYFELFWHQQPENLTHLIEGEYKGEGPWKVGDAVISVLGCHGCDADLATAFAEWQMYLQMCGDDYPAEQAIKEYAVKIGALL